jgi:tetratricopeptide (TPR) repeat protein
MGQKISVCIVTRDHERFIEPCLKSIKPIASEIIIYDLGSKDKTKKIAKKYGKVFNIKFENDYSKLKNKLAIQAKGDWILFLEPEEVLAEDTQKKLLQFLESLLQKNVPLIFQLKVFNLQPGGYPGTTYFKSVLFKNGQNIIFNGLVHEYPVCTKGELIIQKTPFSMNNFESFKLPGEIQKKAINNINLLLEAIEKSKDKSRNYHYFYHLGNAYCQVYDFHRAMEAYNRANYFFQQLKNKSYIFYGELLVKITGTMAFCTQNYKECLIFVDELLKVSPKFLDALFLLGYCKQNIGNYKEAVKVYQQILNLSVNNNEQLNPLGLTSLEASLIPLVKFNLGRCFTNLENKVKGIDYLEQSLNLSPDSKQTLIHLIRYYLLENNLTKALPLYFKNTVQKHHPKEKENMEIVSKLPVDSQDYKEMLIKFLKSMENLDEWTELERKHIKDKIDAK